jgi:hypothetical protein
MCSRRTLSLFSIDEGLLLIPAAAKNVSANAVSVGVSLVTVGRAGSLDTAGSLDAAPSGAGVMVGGSSSVALRLGFGCEAMNASWLASACFAAFLFCRSWARSRSHVPTTHRSNGP